MNISKPTKKNSDRLVCVVDDENDIRFIFKAYLESEGYTVREFDNVQSTIAFIDETGGIDLVVSDIIMPSGNGDIIIKYLTEHAIPIPVIILTALNDMGTAVNFMKLGAFDFLTKPIQYEPFMATIRKGLDFKDILDEKNRLQEENRSYQRDLERKVEERTRMIEAHFVETIKSLANAVEEKDPYTKGHSYRVSIYARLISEELGLPKQTIGVLERSALLHDIGKIGIEEAILCKKGKLSPEEYSIMKEHPLKSVKIIEPISNLRELIAPILSHHERIDGTGYPNGITGDLIPFEAKILCVADAFDAMTSIREYREASLSPADAIKEIERNIDTQFDRTAGEALCKVYYDNPELLENYVQLVHA